MEPQQPLHFVVNGVLGLAYQIPLCVSEYSLCLWCSNLFSSVHRGPFPPIAPDVESLSQTSAPLSPS